MEEMSYYSECECGQTLEGIGDFDREGNTLYGVDCVACGLEFAVIGWLDECEECGELHHESDLCGFEGEEKEQ